MRMSDLQAGWPVVANDGRSFGTVKSVGQEFLHVSRSGFSSDVYVPASAIANVENETIYLNLAKNEAEEMGWEQPPRESDEPEGSSESDLHRHV